MQGLLSRKIISQFVNETKNESTPNYAKRFDHALTLSWNGIWKAYGFVTFESLYSKFELNEETQVGFRVFLFGLHFRKLIRREKRSPVHATQTSCKRMSFCRTQINFSENGKQNARQWIHLHYTASQKSLGEKNPNRNNKIFCSKCLASRRPNFYFFDSVNLPFRFGDQLLGAK